VPNQESIPGPPRLLQLVADLHIGLSSEGVDAQAHLHGDSEGMVLDVDDPAAFLREARRQEVPLAAVRQLVSDTPVQVHSGGRRLASVRLTPAGKVRVRPTPAGLLSVPKIALSGSRGRWVGVVAGIVLAAAVATRGGKSLRR
jgi:hypothetical protein